MSDGLGSPGGTAGPGPYGEPAFPTPSPRFWPLARLAAWTAPLLLANAAMIVLNVGISLATRGVGEQTTPTRIEDLSGADVAGIFVGFVHFAVYVAAAALFIAWFFRAYENLRPLAAPEPRRSSGWTIGAWFVPVVDYILPKLMLNEVWRGSDPDPARAAREVSIPAFHHGWWALWVVGSLTGLVVAVETGYEGFRSAFLGYDTVTVSALSSAAASLGGLLNAAAAGLGALVVRRTTERQEARWRQLTVGFPGQVPSPA